MDQSAEDDLWHAANEMLREYGRDATIAAAQRADEHLEHGDLDGAHQWRTILKRITILLERPHGPLH